jgi:hypothetical protein
VRRTHWGLDLDDIAPDVGAHASDRGLFPGDVLLTSPRHHRASGATRERPLDTQQIRRRLLPGSGTRAPALKAELHQAAAMIA